MNSNPSLKTKSILTTFIVLSSLCIAENTLSQVNSTRDKWNRDFVSVTYDKVADCVVIYFRTFDYHFGPANENGYLEYCDFGFSTDGGKDYYYLMREEAVDQVHENWTWVYLKNKVLNADLRISGCFNPEDGYPWPDNVITQRVEVYNAGARAFLTIKWFVLHCFKVTNILVTGKWHVNGPYSDDYFTECYDVPLPSNFKSKNCNGALSAFKKLNISEANTVVISKDDDAVLIKGVDPGVKLDVYTTSGAIVKSMVSNENVVKIKLDAKQIYIVKVGQTRYKIAL